jgi:pimeloyl-ACP methyl ester carboxylesterase
MEPAEVQIKTGPVVLDGTFTPPHARNGVVVFAHGSGSSRMSPRNRYVAGVLHEAGLGSLLFDLLTPDEEIIDGGSGALRFDIPFLAERLAAALDWLASHAPGAAIGLFGASTGAAAALVAAALRPRLVRAVVSRGGRPDLAYDVLPRVRAPTLLVVGGDDRPVLAMNEEAAARMKAHVQLAVVPGAGHLFDEPGTLDVVADLAAQWFGRHLGTRAAFARV